MAASQGTERARGGRAWILGMAAFVAALWTLAAGASPTSGGASVDPFRGLGAWVDIFDGGSLRDPEHAVRAMDERDVRTLFLETSNYQQGSSIPYPAATARFIEAAHERGMKVVAWYLPGLKKVKRDRHRTMDAIRFRTEGGEGFDGFGLDIEASIVRKVRVRNRKLLRLSRSVGRRVDPNYPLAAIVPSPRAMEHLAPGYWPKFPYRKLARVYDAFMPMGYFTYRKKTSGRRGAYRYTRQNIRIVRRKTGDRSIPIHVIGGLADETGAGEARGFVRAALDRRALGASLYDFGTTGAEDWRALERIADG